MGAAIGQAADAHEQIQAKHDEAAVRQADAADALEIMKIKQGALSAKGIDAQSAIEQANKDSSARTLGGLLSLRSLQRSPALV